MDWCVNVRAVVLVGRCNRHRSRTRGGPAVHQSQTQRTTAAARAPRQHAIARVARVVRVVVVAGPAAAGTAVAVVTATGR